MAEKKGRPVEPDARHHATMIRMNDEEKADLEWLTGERNAELQGEGVKVRPPDVIRWLLRREVDARRAAPPPTKPTPTKPRK